MILHAIDELPVFVSAAQIDIDGFEDPLNVPCVYVLDDGKIIIPYVEP